MSDEPAHSFFPLLKRREAYSQKNDGSFYHYTHYRIEISEDCQERCVYCNAHHDELGGAESMELDHFRPHSLPHFAHLEHHPHNLHHSCGRCNRLKSNHWPGGEAGLCNDDCGFIDPFGEDRNEFFQIAEDGTLIPCKPPSSYLIQLLALNRPFLKVLRRRRLLMSAKRAFEIQNVPKWQELREGKGGVTVEQLAEQVLTYVDIVKRCEF